MRIIMGWAITGIGFIGMIIFIILSVIDVYVSTAYYLHVVRTTESIGITGNIPILLLFLILSVVFYFVWKFGKKLKTQPEHTLL